MGYGEYALTRVCIGIYTKERLIYLKIGFVAGDMKDPTRDIPRVLNVAMTIVLISFLLVNLALYTIIPIETMRETTTPIVVRQPG
jgi:amino acid transporter